MSAAIRCKGKADVGRHRHRWRVCHAPELLRGAPNFVIPSMLVKKVRFYLQNNNRSAEKTQKRGHYKKYLNPGAKFFVPRSTDSSARLRMADGAAVSQIFFPLKCVE